MKEESNINFIVITYIIIMTHCYHVRPHRSQEEIDMWIYGSITIDDTM